MDEEKFIAFMKQVKKSSGKLINKLAAWKIPNQGT
jgi:hypothetical protein